MESLKKIQLPQQVLVGNNLFENFYSVLSEFYDDSNIAIICGKKTQELVKEKMIPGLQKNKAKYNIFLCCESSKEEVDRIKSQIQNNYNVVFGVGGGKNIDVAKLIAYELNLDFISIPTAPSHDGIASSFASIKKNGRKYSIKTKPPLTIICDVKIIKKADKRFFASGFCDAYSNFIATADWNLAKKDKDEYFGNYAYELSRVSSLLVLKNIDSIVSQSEEGTRTLLEALISGGIAMEIAGSSRPCSGSEHLIAHAIDLYNSNFLHGEAVGIGTLICAYLHKYNWKKVKTNLQIVNVPLDILNDSGLMKKIFETAKKIGIERNRYTILDKTSEREFEECLKNISDDNRLCAKRANQI
ncbi:MAG: iron-containing alcohol dehydrogenase [Candidatus Aenigmarchaeota archaeon]|nr:iron-containing alcohol dehydrogenase [Candidatus Aenigmarchaeota archaeon]